MNTIGNGATTASPAGTVGAATLRVEGLVKRYPKGPVANDGLDLGVAAGEVFGLLGPNGAGKTTLVRQIIGLVKPTAGRILLSGYDLTKEPERARAMCSYLPQVAVPLDSFKPREIIELVGRMRGGARKPVRERTRALIAGLELEEWAETMGHTLSGGVRRLVGFAAACAWPAPLLILDEPTNDVDPLRRRLLWRTIRAMKEQGTTILLVTHNVAEAEGSVDRLAVIDRGKIVAQGTPAELKSESRGALHVEIRLRPGAPEPPLPDLGGEPLRLGRRLRLTIAQEDAASAIAWAQEAVRGGSAEEYTLGPTTLEDTYLRLIGRDDAAAYLEAAP